MSERIILIKVWMGTVNLLDVLPLPPVVSLNQTVLCIYLRRGPVITVVLILKLYIYDLVQIFFFIWRRKDTVLLLGQWSQIHTLDLNSCPFDCRWPTSTLKTRWDYIGWLHRSCCVLSARCLGSYERRIKSREQTTCAGTWHHIKYWSELVILSGQTKGADRLSSNILLIL